MVKDKTEKNISDYKNQKNLVNPLCDAKKTVFFTSAIAKCNGNQKGIYKLVRKLCNKPTTPVYPDAPSDNVLANQFSDYFKSKIDTINEQLAENQQQPEQPSQSCKCEFKAFSAISQEELRKYILNLPTKSCKLDPIPTSLLKDCIDCVLPVLTDIVNRCLTTGYMPNVFKSALISPIPKKSKTPHFKNFRPISNLPFLSKVVERIVIDKLSTYCSDNDLNERYQSAYRRHHSCETALL